MWATEILTDGENKRYIEIEGEERPIYLPEEVIKACYLHVIGVEEQAEFSRLHNLIELILDQRLAKQRGENGK